MDILVLLRRFRRKKLRPASGLKIVYHGDHGGKVDWQQSGGGWLPIRVVLPLPRSSLSPHWQAVTLHEYAHLACGYKKQCLMVSAEAMAWAVALRWVLAAQNRSLAIRSRAVHSTSSGPHETKAISPRGHRRFRGMIRLRVKLWWTKKSLSSSG
ncbi:MAG: hypothetical protein UY15_C0037G0004 [Parcubacteria group bacterium GW2011_GWA2_47_9]|nr:MAG: hypothetical protein UY15_C0037G0004 [Parcubacteria group bacterium GW2011_GWA2_47_9]